MAQKRNESRQLDNIRCQYIANLDGVNMARSIQLDMFRKRMSPVVNLKRLSDSCIRRWTMGKAGDIVSTTNRSVKRKRSQRKRIYTHMKKRKNVSVTVASVRAIADRDTSRSLSIAEDITVDPNQLVTNVHSNDVEQTEDNTESEIVMKMAKDIPKPEIKAESTPTPLYSSPNSIDEIIDAVVEQAVAEVDILTNDRAANAIGGSSQRKKQVKKVKKTKDSHSFPRSQGKTNVVELVGEPHANTTLQPETCARSEEEKARSSAALDKTINDVAHGISMFESDDASFSQDIDECTSSSVDKTIEYVARGMELSDTNDTSSFANIDVNHTLDKGVDIAGGLDVSVKCMCESMNASTPKTVCTSGTCSVSEFACATADSNSAVEPTTNYLNADDAVDSVCLGTVDESGDSSDNFHATNAYIPADQSDAQAESRLNTTGSDVINSIGVGVIGSGKSNSDTTMNLDILDEDNLLANSYIPAKSPSNVLMETARNTNDEVESHADDGFDTCSDPMCKTYEPNSPGDLKLHSNRDVKDVQMHNGVQSFRPFTRRGGGKRTVDTIFTRPTATRKVPIKHTKITKSKSSTKKAIAFHNMFKFLKGHKHLQWKLPVNRGMQPKVSPIKSPSKGPSGLESPNTVSRNTKIESLRMSRGSRSFHKSLASLKSPKLVKVSPYVTKILPMADTPAPSINAANDKDRVNDVNVASSKDENISPLAYRASDSVTQESRRDTPVLGVIQCAGESTECSDSVCAANDYKPVVSDALSITKPVKPEGLKPNNIDANQVKVDVAEIVHVVKSHQETKYCEFNSHIEHTSPLPENHTVISYIDQYTETHRDMKFPMNIVKHSPTAVKQVDDSIMEHDNTSEEDTKCQGTVRNDSSEKPHKLNEHIFSIETKPQNVVEQSSPVCNGETETLKQDLDGQAESHLQIQQTPTITFESPEPLVASDVKNMTNASPEAASDGNTLAINSSENMTPPEMKRACQNMDACVATMSIDNGESSNAHMTSGKSIILDAKRKPALEFAQDIFRCHSVSTVSQCMPQSEVLNEPNMATSVECASIAKALRTAREVITSDSVSELSKDDDDVRKVMDNLVQLVVYQSDIDSIPPGRDNTIKEEQSPIRSDEQQKLETRSTSGSLPETCNDTARTETASMTCQGIDDDQLSCDELQIVMDDYESPSFDEIDNVNRDTCDGAKTASPLALTTKPCKRGKRKKSRKLTMPAKRRIRPVKRHEFGRPSLKLKIYLSKNSAPRLSQTKPEPVGRRKKRSSKQHKKSTYPRRDKIFYLSDYQNRQEKSPETITTPSSLSEANKLEKTNEDITPTTVPATAPDVMDSAPSQMDPAQPKSQKQKRKRKGGSDGGSPFSPNVNTEQIDSHGRLSIEFANHNWFMEKYSLQSTAPEPEAGSLDSTTPHGKRRRHRKSSNADSEKPKKKHRDKLTAQAHQKSAEVKPLVDHSQINHKVVGEAGPTDGDVNLVQDMTNIANKKHISVDHNEQTTLQHETVSEKQGSDLKILEVVSLAGYVKHEQDSDAAYTDVADDDTRLTIDTDEVCDEPINMKCALPDVVPPESEYMDMEPQDLSIKPCDEEPKPLDLSMKSTNCMALDLSIKPRNACMSSIMSMTHSVQNENISESAYACFNITESKRDMGTNSGAIAQFGATSPTHMHGTSPNYLHKSLSNNSTPISSEVKSHEPHRDLSGHNECTITPGDPSVAHKPIPTVVPQLMPKSTALNATFVDPAIGHGSSRLSPEVKQTSSTPLHEERSVASTLVTQSLATAAVMPPALSRDNSHSQMSTALSSAPGPHGLAHSLDLLKIQRDASKNIRSSSQIQIPTYAMISQSDQIQTTSSLRTHVSTHTSHQPYSSRPLPYPRHLPDNIKPPSLQPRNSPHIQRQSVPDHPIPNQTVHDVPTTQIQYHTGVLPTSTKADHLGQFHTKIQQPPPYPGKPVTQRSGVPPRAIVNPPRIIHSQQRLNTGSAILGQPTRRPNRQVDISAQSMHRPYSLAPAGHLPPQRPTNMIQPAKHATHPSSIVQPSGMKLDGRDQRQGLSSQQLTNHAQPRSTTQRQGLSSQQLTNHAQPRSTNQRQGLSSQQLTNHAQSRSTTTAQKHDIQPIVIQPTHGGSNVQSTVLVNTPQGNIPLPLAQMKCGACDIKAMFLCSGCKRVAYCSQKCQLAAWKKHRPRCQS